MTKVRQLLHSDRIEHANRRITDAKTAIHEARVIALACGDAYSAGLLTAAHEALRQAMVVGDEP